MSAKWLVILTLSVMAGLIIYIPPALAQNMTADDVLSNVTPVGNVINLQGYQLTIDGATAAGAVSLSGITIVMQSGAGTNGGGRIVVNSAQTVAALTVTEYGWIDLNAGNLTVTAGVTTSSTMFTLDDGTPGSANQLICNLTVGAGGILQIAEDVTLNGTLAFAGAGELAFSPGGKTFTTSSTISTAAGGLLTIGAGNGGTIANGGSMTIGSGGLTVSNASTISGSIANNGSSTWTLNGDLTYNGADIPVGGYTITLAGTADMLGSGALYLSAFSSVIDFQGTAQTVSKVTFADPAATIIMTTSNTITTLTSLAEGIIDLKTGDLTVTDAMSTTGSYTLQLSDTDAGVVDSLIVPGGLTIGAGGTVKINNDVGLSGTLSFAGAGGLDFSPGGKTFYTSSTIATTAGGLLTIGATTGGLISNAGAMTINTGGFTNENASTIYGPLAVGGSSTWTLNEYLTYNGDDIPVGGYTITLAGTANMPGSGALYLSASTSKLDFQGTNQTVSKVTFADPSATIIMTTNNTITTLTSLAEGIIDLKTGDLTVTDAMSTTGSYALQLSDSDAGAAGNLIVPGGLTIGAGGSFQINDDVGLSGTLTYAGAGELDFGSASKTLTTSSTITTTAGGLLTIGASTSGTLANTGALTINSGGLSVINASTISGPLALGASGTWTLTNDLTYNGGVPITVGVNTLTLAGFGDFLNSHPIQLDNASSIVDLAGTNQTISGVQYTNAAGTVKMSANNTIYWLTFAGSGGVIDLNAGNLTLTDTLDILAYTLKVQDSATGSANQIIADLTVGDGGTLLVSNSFALTGALLFEGAGTLDMSTTDGVILFLAGSNPMQNTTASGATTITMTGVNGGAAETLTFFTGGVELSQDMTFALTDVTVDYSSLTNLILTSGAGIDATFDPGETTINLPALTNIGGDGSTNTLILASAGNNVDYSIGGTAVTVGNLDINESSMTIGGQLTISSGHTMTLDGATEFTAPAGTFTESGTLINNSSGTVIVNDIEYIAGIWPPADYTADIVIGQANFTTGASGLTQTTLNTPTGIAIDTTVSPHVLYISERYNHRILGYYNYPFLQNGAPADFVIGQTDFTSQATGTTSSTLNDPYDIAVDKDGNLWVAERLNNRVLAFISPATTDHIADLVIGQGGSFSSSTANNGGVSDSTLNNPYGITIDDSNRVYICDTENNRILVFNDPLNTDVKADYVIGQADFTSNSFSVSDSTLERAIDCAVAPNGDVFVCDNPNSRVLRFLDPLNTDTNADQVFGQVGSFTTNTANNPSLNAEALNYPAGVFVDKSGNLYVSDNGNNRVLVYATPLDTTADYVYGQNGIFTTGTVNTTADGLDSPRGVLVDDNANILITEYDHHRVLKFMNSSTANLYLTASDVSFGAIDYGTADTLTFPIFNSGIDTLFVDSIFVQSTHLTIGNNFTVLDSVDTVTATPADTMHVRVAFSGTPAGSFADSLVLFYRTGGGSITDSTTIAVSGQAVAPVVLSLPGLIYGRGRDTVRAPINVSGLTTSDSAMSFDMTLVFPDSLLTFDHLSTTGYLADGITIFDTVIARNLGETMDTLIITAADSQLIPGDGVLLDLLFVIDSNSVDGDTADVEFEEFIFNEGSPTVIMIDGWFENAELQLIGDVDSNGTIEALDASLVLQEKVRKFTPEDSNQIARMDVSGNGAIRAYDAALILQHVAGYITTFPAGSSFVDKPVVVAEPSADVQLVSVKENVVEWQLNLQQAEGVTAADFVLEYDAEQFAYVGYNLPEKFAEFMTAEENEPGRFAMALASAQPMETDGRVVNLHFRRLGEGAVDQNIQIMSLYVNESLLIGNEILSVDGLPETYAISQNFPNPFNPVTTIRYQIPEDVQVKITVYNLLGQVVATLVDEHLPAGYYSKVWSGHNKAGLQVASGVYIYRMQAGDFVKTKKMLLLK